MKRAIMALSILCGGLLIINPISNKIFAENTQEEIKKAQVQTIELSKTSNNNEDNKEKNKEVSKKNEENENKTSVEVVKVLNQEQAKDVLAIHNTNVEYTYQGDENTFEALKNKGLNGYVFLANVEGDLGFFVDKNTANVYYFHPSGYLELAK